MPKEKSHRPNRFVLNKVQLEKLSKISQQFPDVEWFTLEADNSNGIGPVVTVKFNLFNDTDKDIDTSVDITDVSTW